MIKNFVFGFVSVLLCAGIAQSTTIACSRKIYPGFFHSTFTCEMNGIDLVDGDDVTVEETINLNHLKVLNSGIQKLPVRLLARLISLLSISVKAKILHVDELSMKKVLLIDLSMNEIQSLAEFAFSGCSVLKELDLHGNKISTIPGNIFNGLLKLQSVNFAENNIKQLPYELFAQTPALEVFWAQSNILEVINLEMFTHLKNLKQLDFSHNRLKTVERPRSLLSMKSLISSNLELSFNKLGSLSLENTDIPSINASSNVLRNITLGKNYREVYAEDNEIQQISIGESIRTLEELNLAGNQLKNNLGDICQCVKLQEVVLGSNGIENVGFCFSKMDTLKHLNLQRNKISHIDYGYFHGNNILETLDLSYNSIEAIDPHVLSLLHNLKSLYLDGNRIEDLTEQLATILPQLSIIGLSHNRFQCNRLLAIFRQLKGTRNDIVLNIDKPAIVNTTNIHGMACFNSKFNDSAPFRAQESNATIWREIQKIKFELQDYANLMWKMMKSHENLRDGVAANFSQLKADESSQKNEEIIDGGSWKSFRKFMQLTNVRIDQLESKTNETDIRKLVKELNGQKKYTFIGIFLVIIVILVGFVVIWYHSDKVCIKYCLYRKISLQQSGESLRTFT